MVRVNRFSSVPAAALRQVGPPHLLAALPGAGGSIHFVIAAGGARRRRGATTSSPARRRPSGTRQSVCAGFRRGDAAVRRPAARCSPGAEYVARPGGVCSRSTRAGHGLTGRVGSGVRDALLRTPPLAWPRNVNASLGTSERSSEPCQIPLPNLFLDLTFPAGVLNEYWVLIHRCEAGR
jgi:hypothetical protein